MMRDEITRLAMRDAENETPDNLRSDVHLVLCPGGLGGHLGLGVVRL